MKKLFLLSIVSFAFLVHSNAQLIAVENAYQSSFNQAYDQYPDIPRGVLEAFSYQQTRMTHLTDAQEGSCTGMPKYVGVMGLIDNGKEYFNENLKLVSLYSGKSVEFLKQNPHDEIIGFAKFYHSIIEGNHATNSSTADKIFLLKHCSEIPIQTNIEGNYFAMDAFIYGIVQFLTDPGMQSYYGFPNHHINGEQMFGDRWEILSSKHIYIHADHIENETHQRYNADGEIHAKSADYGPAIWNPAASCNHSIGRSGTPITAITIHDVEGSYAGCIAYFQNCAAVVSAHYVMRSSDGQVTQMVLEADKAWHVGTENNYTVGIEHEGFNNNPAWWTTAMYNSSAALVIDIADSYGIDKIRTGWWPWLAATEYAVSGIPGSCVHIKGHIHFPNQNHNDPGIYWDWNRYFKLINTPPAANMLTTATGNFYDSGGLGGNYVNDERTITTVAPAGATTVTVTFNTFNLENTWDYLYIYDGADLNAPLIGYYTGTTNPGTITSSGNSLTFEFRSDCATVSSGWSAVYTSTSAPFAADSIPPVTALSIVTPWQTTDFDVQFTDADELGGSGLEKSFYHVSYFDGTGMYANTERGFLRDEFDLISLHPQWTVATGTWNLSGTYVEQNDEALSNTNIYASLKQDLSNIYMYEFSAAIGGAGANRRAGFHFFCDSAQLTNRGNSYFVWMRQDQQTIEIYKVTNDVFSLMHTDNISMNADQWYNYKVFYDRISGNMKVYRDNVIITEWTDPLPYTTGKYISFRSGNADYKVGNIKVYRSRYANSNTNITVGNCAGCDLPYQNSAPSLPAGTIYSFSKDSANNLSSTIVEDVNVDWTAPAALSYINDISIFDEDTITNNTLAGGNWNIASDTNSAINRYIYAIGTTIGDSDVVNWHDNWFYTNFLDTISLITNQWYYISARAENGAGLQSLTATSDGFIYVNLGNEPVSIPTISIYPNPASDFLYLHGFDQKDLYTIEWMDLKGAVVQQEKLWVNMADIMLTIPENLSNSFYMLRIRSNQRLYHFRVNVIR
jgi:N-acetyl-anhydromuramyl-L-alanine amidase AmpD